MTDRTQGARGLVVLALAAGLVLLAPAPPTSAQSPGLTVDGRTTYRLDPEAGVVHVTAVLDLTNTEPPRRVGNIIETSYFDSIPIPALGPVAAATARSSAGRDLAVRVDSKPDGLSALVVELSPDLVHGSPQTVTVTWDLPGQPARSPAPTRVNPAFASWLAVGLGDPGRIDVTVEVPAEFTLDLATPAVPLRSTTNGRTVARLEDLADLNHATFFVSARDDDALSERAVETAGADVTVRPWPGDDAWSDFVAETVADGIPLLEELIGRGLPGDQLAVVESSAAYHYGYAGFFDKTSGIIEVGDELDRHTLLHELGHVWINDDLFVERWITEGLAEEVAWRAMGRLDEPVDASTPIDPTAAGALPLQRWGSQGLFDLEREATEAWAYAASRSLVHDLVEDIGTDGLTRMLDAAFDGDIAWQGDPDAEPLRVARDWRYFLDLAELVGGSTVVHDLVRDHVVAESHRPLLRQRARARDAYDSLVADGDGWSAPLAVRTSMARWQFRQADRQVTRAVALRNRAGEVVAAAGALGGDPAPRLEAAYEAADDLDALGDDLDAEAATATALAGLADDLATPSPWQRVGLVGLGADLGPVVDAWAAGDDDVSLLADKLETTLEAATTRGAATAAAAGLLTIAAAAQARVRRRNTRERDDRGRT